MPKLVTFKGRPVKKKTPVGNQELRLTFYTAVAGARGPQEIVSRQDWETYGQEQYFPAGQMPDVREIAARY